MSKKVKIVLVVSVCLLLAIIGLIYFGKGSEDQTALSPDETQTSDDIYASDTTTYPDNEVAPTSSSTTLPNSSVVISPVASASIITQTIVAKTTATAKNKSGQTTEQSQYVEVNPPANSVTPYPGSGELDWTRRIRTYAVAPTQELLKTDYCKLTKLSDSWSQPIEKTFCGLGRFVNSQLITPLSDFLCNISAAAISLNFKENVTSQMVNGECRIIDR